jgi:hypothetical protein
MSTAREIVVRDGRADHLIRPPSPERAARLARRAERLGITVAELHARNRAYRKERKRKRQPSLDKLVHGRSSITNGREFLPGVDKRSPWVRRAKDVMSQLISDAGGLDVVPEAKKLVARRAGILEAELIHLEARFAALGGGAKTEDLDLYCKITNAQRRLFEALGLERVPRDVTPNLKDYLKHAEAQDAETVPRAEGAAP